MGTAVEWFELVAALVVILASAEVFTNGVEWVGRGFGLSEGAVGSVLAAVGTALPETLLPLVAVLTGKRAGDQIGMGAILGAPFMLTTLAMLVTAIAVLILARRGRRDTEIRGDRRVLLQDLGYFLVMYSLALVAGVVHVSWFKWTLAVVLVIGYVIYVRRHFESPAEAVEEAEAHGELRPLYLQRITARGRSGSTSGVGSPASVATSPALTVPSARLSVVQTLVALAGMVGGARLFVTGIDRVAVLFHVPELALALLIAPVATELPEKFNSVIWVSRRKDTLAMGNLTGAMVFQSCFPVTVGLLLTPWRLTGDALVAALVALGAGTVLWVTLKVRGTLSARLLLLQGVFYVGYVTFVLTRL
jgi:cation:H+ antiporter